MSNELSLKHFYLGGCLQINQDSIYVFGGKCNDVKENSFTLSDDKAISQAFLVTFIEEAEEEISDNLRLILEFDYDVK